MAMSDVYGLARFREYMAGLEDCYAVIGGTACDILLREADMRFRATKDIDVILVVEGRLPEVGRAVWRMVTDGGYTCGWKSSDRARFYRFTEPGEPGFPSMIELFNTSPDFIPESSGLTIVPLPIDDEVSSLSAILLDPDYYAFMKAGRKTVDGVTVLDEVHLVPFKAKAYVDLSARKAAGEHVNAKDLKKHKKDVFRLLQLFGPDAAAELPASIRADVEEFCDMARREDAPLEQIGMPFTLDEALEMIARTYGLRS